MKNFNIRDEQLMLYFYSDGLSATDRTEIEAALQESPALAKHYATLQRELSALRMERPAPAPPELLQRLHTTIDRATPLPPAPSGGFSMPSFFWGAAITAALAIGVGIGFFASQENVAVAPGTVTAASGSDAFTRSLRVHLRETERGISALPGTEDRTMLVLEIIHQNRIFERAAEHHDSRDLARVLRAFEPILLRLAADDLAPDDADALREQLAFELKVMLTKLEQKPSKRLQTT
ncbi:MAG: hypothetical protein KJO82_05365 [Gammaproteobacteria bacterium]|nr:hypothetical protein [Gammaproteobacteria bacterium]